MKTMIPLRPLPFVWPYAAIYWAVFVWAFLPEFRIVRRARRQQTATDSRSLQVILAVGSLSFFAAYPMAFVPALQITAVHRVPVFALGIATMVAGALLRRHCWRLLGESFTGDVRVREDQAVVSAGAYRFVRHPSYTAGVLLNAGIGIALGSWAAALLLTVTSVAAYVYRMNVEERALASVIGQPYRDFMSTRKRLIPFIY